MKTNQKPMTKKMKQIIGHISDLDVKIDSLNNLPNIKDKYFGSYLDFEIKDANEVVVSKFRIGAENFDSSNLEETIKKELAQEKLRLERQIKEINANI